MGLEFALFLTVSGAALRVCVTLGEVRDGATRGVVSGTWRFRCACAGAVIMENPHANSVMARACTPIISLAVLLKCGSH